MFRFTIRDVLWLTALLAVACGWFIDHSTSTWEGRVAAARLLLAEEKLNELGWQTVVLAGGRELTIQKIHKYLPQE